MEQISLKDRTIVITGASSGAGRAAALAFAPHEPALVLAARNIEALNDVAEECRELGASILVVPTDVTDPKAMIGLANAANDWRSQIDIWVNNAGILVAGSFDQTPMEVHEQVIQTNLMGYMSGIHAVMPFFKEQGYGTIINNISIGGYLPVPYGSSYTASKFALRGFSEALKAELSEWPEIYVCDLFPAFLDTPGMQHAGNYTGKVLKPAPPVYDPTELAAAMVEVAINPKSTKYVGNASLLLKLSHAVFPELTTKITGLVMRRYFKHAELTPSTSGNVFNTVEYGMSTNGGWNFKPNSYGRLVAAAGIAAGIAAGVLFMVKGNR